MYFLFQEPIYDAVQSQLNIDLNNDEYSKTIFSVDSIKTEEPFEVIYQGHITVIKNDNPIYYLYYTVNSHENIPNQSVCTLEIDETIQSTLEMENH